MNLSNLSTTTLITRLETIETAIRVTGRYSGGRDTTVDLAARWEAVRRELDSRPLDELLAAWRAG